LDQLGCQVVGPIRALWRSLLNHQEQNADGFRLVEFCRAHHKINVIDLGDAWFE
jgi:hypothetical protein